MSGRLQTAIAMVTAGNLQSAEKLLLNILSDDPYDADAKAILVLCTLHKKDHRGALNKARLFIAEHPDHILLRQFEIMSLQHLHLKTEWKTALDFFEQHFSGSWDGFQMQKMLYVSFHGTVPELDTLLNKFQSEFVGPELDSAVTHSVTLNNIGAYLRAEPYLRKAASLDGNGATIHSEFAYNQLMLCRLKSARRHARITLAAMPRRLEKRVIISSYLMYYPPVLYVHLIYLLWRTGVAYLGKVYATVISLIFLPLALWPMTVVAGLLGNLIGPIGVLFIYSAIPIHLLLMLSFHWRVAAMLARRLDRRVALRDY